MFRSTSCLSCALPSLLILLLLAFGGGCSFDEGANAARGCDANCAPGKCYLDYCLQTVQVGNPIEGAGIGASGIGQPGTSGISGGPGAGAGTGAGTSGVGNAGASGAPPGCMSGVEVCNGLDDDCDGQTDEALDLGSCEAVGTGMCTTGVMRCENGSEACIVAAEPTAEVCNGLDDDCDGEADEDTAVGCYPDGTAGCSARADGGFDCVGLCAAGMRVCQDGQLGECSGFVPPADEKCGGGSAADENCNGEVDDGCPCSGDETQSCYTGPARTAGVGRCREGEQRCENGVFGACEGSVVPAVERCTNQAADDDCNGRTDDVFGAGLFCLVSSNRGLCRYGVRECSGGSLVCVTTEPAAEDNRCDGLDEDCDGGIDETFALATDEANCGACGVRCASGQQCCGGACRNLQNDADHCGACGSACGAGGACCAGQCVATNTTNHCGGCGGCGAGQSCCGGQCVATNTDANCGACGNACGANQACCDGQCVQTDTVNHCGGCQRCGEGLACCGGQCVTLDTSAHCGSCAGCEAGQACCGNTCVATNTEEHCSGCGGCGGGERCCEGTCVQRNSPEDLCSPGGCDPTACAPCTCVGNECVDGQGLLCL